MMLYSVLIGVLMSVVGMAAETARLRVDTHSLPPELRAQASEAYFASYQKALTCPYLAENHPHIRAILLRNYENLMINLKYKPYDPTNEGECAYTYPSRLLNGNTIRLRPLAFEKDCWNLKSVIFHEMTHLAWILGSEVDVAHLEIKCLDF